MKEVLCNEDKPTLSKVAMLLGIKLTNIHRKAGIYYCSLNGKDTRLSVAKTYMVDIKKADRIKFINHSGKEVIWPVQNSLNITFVKG